MRSVQQDGTTVMSSTCWAMLGYQSDTQIPLCPYCLNVRLEGIMPFLDVPGMAVNLGRIDSGRGCPCSSTSLGLGSKISMWLGPPSIKSQITDLALGGWWGCLGLSGSARS